MLRKRCLHNSGLAIGLLGKQGRKQLIPLQNEEKFASYIKKSKAELDFGPTKQEMINIVSKYLEANAVSNFFC